MDRDMTQKRYFDDNARFADLINGVHFAGRQVIGANDLREMDSQTGIWRIPAMIVGRSRKGAIKLRDLIRKSAIGTNFLIMGIENQENVDYGMALRGMAYDLGEYEKQAAKIRKRMRKEKGKYTPGEVLYGFGKNSRLFPIVTTVLYYGETWDGPRSLWDMMNFTDIPEELKTKIHDYKLNVVEVRKLENTDVFRTDIKLVFDFVRNANDKEALKKLVTENSEYQRMDEDAFDMIATCSREERLLVKKEKYTIDGGIDMCKGIQDWLDESKAEGIQQGVEQEIFNSVFENDYSVERGAEKLNISKEEFEEKYENWLEKKNNQ